MNTHKSYDPTWRKWAVVRKGRKTEWFNTEKAAIIYAAMSQGGVVKPANKRGAS